MNGSPKIVACIIAKNEEELLSRCLDSLRGIDTIYIADTGSNDKTIEIAKQYTSNVYTDFVWCDNFAKARNFILSKVKEENAYVISIDCDEYLHDVGKLREAVDLAVKKDAKAINITMVAEDHTAQLFYFPRVFKKCPEVWWEGAIHNHISVLGQDLGHVTMTYGYSPAHRNDPDRAFRILKKVVEETGNGREMFYLGREYFYRNMFEDTVKILGQYVQKSKYLSEKAEAFLVMARSYWQMKMPDDARDALLQAICINPDFKEALAFMSELSWERQGKRWKSFADLADNTDVLFVRNV